MLKRSLVMVMMLVLVGNVFSATTFWWSGLDATDGHDWTKSGNWTKTPWANDPAMPGDSDVASVNLDIAGYESRGVTGTNQSLAIYSGSNVSIGQLDLAPGRGPFTLDVAGQLHVLGNLTIGEAVGGDGTLTVNGGNVTVDGHLIVSKAGIATLNMQSGYVYSEALYGSYSGGPATVNLFGGTLETDMTYLNANTIIDFQGGTLVVNGDIHDKMYADLGYLDLGIFRVNGLTQADEGFGLNVVWDEVAGVTTISAIPEPATFAILGIGAMFLRRKR